MDELRLMRDRVNRGRRYLDKHCPGWRGHIRMVQLDMANSGACVLGQVCGDFHDGLEELLPGRPDEARHNWAVTHGFGIWGGQNCYRELPGGQAWSALTELWPAIAS